MVSIPVAPNATFSDGGAPAWMAEANKMQDLASSSSHVASRGFVLGSGSIFALLTLLLVVSIQHYRRKNVTTPGHPTAMNKNSERQPLCQK